MRTNKYTLFTTTTVLLLMLSFTLSAQHRLIEKRKLPDSNIQIGFEYAELMQNNFSNLGRDNYTFLFGQRFGRFRNGRLGWRYMVIDADLSEKHILNEHEVVFIEGNREDLTGDVHAQRLCIDYYPFSIGLIFSEKRQSYLLQVDPVIYTAAGYNSWGFTNTLYDESYRLNAVTAGGGLRLQTTIMGIFFIENPVFDLFTYVASNRPVQGEIGDTQITRPEHFGIFSWATVGVKIPVRSNN